MENISKALLIATGTLLAVLLVAIGTRIFSSALEVSKQYFDREEINELNAFNSNFTRFAGAVRNNAGSETQKLATIHDIVSTIYFAKDYNASTEVTGPNDPRILRINIRLDHGLTNKTYNNIQDWNSVQLNQLMSRCYYKSDTQPEANDIYTFEVDVRYNDTGRINVVTFFTEDEMDNLTTKIDDIAG